VHLVGEEADPGVVQLLARIRRAAEPMCRYCGSLGGIGEDLAFAIAFLNVGF
jgi:hypothetical protein